jgi:hypothetical protein
VTVNLNPQQLGAWFLRLLAVAGVALAAIPADSIPANVRPYFAIGSAVILAVDRYVTDPSTGTPAPPPAAPSTPTPVAPSNPLLPPA